MRFKRFIKESIHDMEKRCEICNTLLNDMGTCPKCDDGEEDKLEEELTNREKLLRAYPELNFDNPVTEELASEEASCEECALEECSESVVTEDLSVKERLMRAYPGEFHFDSEVTEDLERLRKAFHDDIKFDQKEEEPKIKVPERFKKVMPDDDFDKVDEGWDEYDDAYDFEDDDVEQDRLHAALYGGDRMYCDCGKRLIMTEWGGYCPECEPEEFDTDYADDYESDDAARVDATALQKSADEIYKLAKEDPDTFMTYDSFEEFADEMNISGKWSIPENVSDFTPEDPENITDEEAREYIALVFDSTDLRERLQALLD